MMETRNTVETNPTLRCMKPMIYKECPNFNDPTE